MSLTTHLKTTLGAGACLLATLALTPQVSQAVPSFARQTGLPCSSCHSIFPELTAFGRDFKMNGYTMTGLKQIEQKSAGEMGGVKINEIPPLSAMLQVSPTHTSKTATDHRTITSIFRTSSVFSLPARSRRTWAHSSNSPMDQESRHFGLDNTDIRYANHTQIGGADTIYGLTLEQQPDRRGRLEQHSGLGFPVVRRRLSAGTGVRCTDQRLVDNGVAGCRWLYLLEQPPLCRSQSLPLGAGRTVGATT